MKTQVAKEKAKGMLVKGKAAAKPKNMEYNKKVMEKAGYSPKRAAATAYGEVGVEKAARKHERDAMLKKSKTMGKTEAKHKDIKEDKALVKKMVKKSCRK
ncbi:MAG: hypothetical protein AB7F29_13855 [Candidatus Nitrosocosmicus sp.]